MNHHAAPESADEPLVEYSREDLVDVAMPVPQADSLTYAIPGALKGSLKLGCRVIAPYLKGAKTGVVVGFPRSTELSRIRPLIDIADSEPPLPERTLELCRWIAEYYCCPLGEVIAAAHPAGMLAESEKAVRLIEGDSGEPMLFQGYSEEISELLNQLRGKKQVPLKVLRRHHRSPGLMPLLESLEKRGLIEIIESILPPKLKPRWETVLTINDELREDYIETWLGEQESKTPKRAAIIRYLRDSPPVTRKTLMTETGVSSSIVKLLINKGLINEGRREIIREKTDHLAEYQRIVHTEEQKSAIGAVNEAFDRGGFAPFLLFGVTGSGKTEVYLEAILHCLEAGKTAMVLVPEIALTPQISSRFRRRFGGQVVIMHSRISAGERYDSWRRLAAGKARVVIGARSALFAPLVNPGLIVVDEEHESTFKQMNRPHYQARDCAVYLAKMAGIPIVLGSATPSIETYENARRGKYKLLELPKRVASGKFSTFHLVDLTKKESLIANTSISPLLMDKIEDRLEHGDRIIILQNRRGFSTFLKCKHCREVETCQNCSLTLTYHITNRRLRCHICGFQKPAPSVCSVCGGSELIYCGTGTQRVEDDLYKLFPDARITRMDLDTTTAIDSHFRILEAFGKGEYDILLGTQMVAKGLDFPDVTLVGIISADTELLRPDFRAEERTFRLLVQAAGRSGRHRPGEVVVQTYNPEHKVFNLVKHNDYIGFFEKTVRDRKTLHYPPFGRLIALRISGLEEAAAARASVELAEVIPREGLKILGPSPALFAKVKRRYYYNILIKTGNLPQSRLGGIKEALKAARGEILQKFRSEDIGIEIDVDPAEVH